MRKIQVTRDLDGNLVAIDEADQIHFATWRKRLRELDPGEIASVGVENDPSSALTAWHIILCKAVYAAQERFTDFRAFRQFLYTMSGYCVDIKVGRKIIKVPGSWSWDALPNDYDRSAAHDAVVLAMHDELVVRTLWPHLRPAVRMEMLLTTIAAAEAKRQQCRAAKAMRVAARKAQAKNQQTEEATA